MNTVKQLAKFDDPTIKMVMVDVKMVLNEIGQKYGITFKTGNIGYSPADFKVTLNIQLAASAEDSTAVAKRQAQLSQIIGFSENIFGRIVISNTGQRFTIVDIKPRKSKYPIVGKPVDVPESDKYALASLDMLFSTKVKFVGEQPKNIWN